MIALGAGCGEKQKVENRKSKKVCSLQSAVCSLIPRVCSLQSSPMGRENVYLNGAILGLHKHEIDAQFDEIVDFAEIGEFIDAPVSAYSQVMTA